MRKRVIWTAVLGAVVLAGCGSKQDANEKNFGAAIGQYLDKKGELCLGSINLRKWPVDVTEMDLRMQKTIPIGTAGQMEALAAVGLASGTDAEVDQMGMFDNKPTGRKFKVKRYVLSDAGKKYYVEKSGNMGLGDFCYGKESIDKIVKWDIPQSFMGSPTETNVKYLYKIDGLADWTKKPEFQAAFPYVAQIIDGAGKKERTHGVKLTNQGWEALGLDN